METQHNEAKHVLIGFADAVAAPEVVWSLVDAGFRVSAFARSDSQGAIRHSRFVTVTPITAPEDCLDRCLQELGAFVERTNPDALMPLDDAALFLLDQLHDRFDVSIAGPTGSCAELALDKRVQIDAARKHGLSVPSTVFVESTEDVDFSAQLFPAVFKPAWAAAVVDGRLHRGTAYFCANESELRKAVAVWDESEPMLLQPAILGTGEGIFGLQTEAGVVGWMSHERIRMMNPQGSGSSACRSKIIDETLKQPIEELLQAYQWRGLFMFEFLRDHDNQPWFMEINGRTWGSLALTRRCRLEYPAWSIQAMTGGGFSPPIPSTYITPLICRHAGRELVHLAMVMRGPQSAPVTPWPSTWSTLFKILLLSPRHRWYNFRGTDPLVFLSDTVSTIVNQLKRRAAR